MKTLTISYVGWGGRTAYVETNADLGRGVRPKTSFGIRRAVWDFAFGIVNGFKLTAIIYFVATRSLSPRLLHLAWKHEGKFINGACPGGTPGNYCPICTRRHGDIFAHYATEKGGQ